MKIRRILATAVAAAVTTPVVLLSAAPAFADTKPAAPAQEQKQNPTLEQLQLAVAKAKTAYDASVIALDAAEKAVEDLKKADNKLKVAAADAQTAADEAAAAKTAADDKLTKAKEALAALPADATAEEKAAAETAVSEAQVVADTAKTTAETKAEAAKQAQKAYDDALAAAKADVETAKQTKLDADKDLEAAKQALKEAEEEEPGEGECTVDQNLVATMTGPQKITAGTSGVFTFRLTNKGEVQLGEVGGYAEAFAMDEEQDKFLDLTWSSANSPKWQPIDDEEGFSSLAALKPGGSFDFKLKVTVDAKAPAGDGIVIGGGAYMNEDGSCGWSEEGAYAEFGIVKGSKPSTGSNGGSNGGGNTNTTEQGGTSTTPVNGGTTGSTNGNLANTGSNDIVPQIALAGGAAVVLGAGAMFIVRRRKAGSNA
ncbi:peptidase [Streptomyces sp. NPDC003035]|uniref:peptidase n=1 Tax=Streptomyces sp. NPDC003035 TaxID=3364676 RepID=UPI0036A9A8C7